MSNKLPIRILRLAIAWTLRIALGLVCAGMLALGVARLAGYQTFTILSGSMEPAIATGDLVFDERISAADARVGDVITFPEPGARRLVTHRLVHKRIARGRAYMRTRGDANNAPERWSIPADGQIGRVTFRVPKGGYASTYVSRRDVQLMLVVVPALLLGILQLVRIWRPGPREFATMRVRRRLLLGPALFAGLAVLGGASTLAAFSSSASNSADSFASAPDWVAPSVASTVIAKTPGYRAGYVKQGGSYYIYANVADTGNPPSGINVATGDVSAITTAGLAVPLLPGSYSAEGTTYNYRSAATTVKNPLAAAGYGYSLTVTDVAANSRLQTGFSVTVDNTVPTASNVQAPNGGPIAGRPDIGDTITYTFSEPIDPQSILAGWTGASTNVVVRVNNTATDTVLIFNSANTTQLPMGSVNLARTDYVTANRTFGASGTPSTMVLTGSTITVTLGTQSGAGTTAAANGTSVWTPQTTPYDRAGNAMSAATATESGAADKEF